MQKIRFSHDTAHLLECIHVHEYGLSTILEAVFDGMYKMEVTIDVHVYLTQLHEKARYSNQHKIIENIMQQLSQFNILHK